MRSLALLFALFAFCGVARAGNELPDTPEGRLARSLLDERRHHEKAEDGSERTRVVWPDVTPGGPSEGAEVLLIDGYISYSWTRLRWHAGKVEAESAWQSRTWFYNPDGESSGHARHAVDPDRFAVAWRAMQYLAGSREEWLGEEGDRAHGSGSHDSHRWVRASTADVARLRFVGDGRHDNTWDQIVARSVFDAFDALIDRKAQQPDDGAGWGAYLTAELRTAMAADAPEASDLASLHMQTLLQLLGDRGGEDAIAVVDSVRARFPLDEDDEVYDRMWIAEEAYAAGTKLRCRFRFDAAQAARLIAGSSGRRHWQNDLAKWVRARWREADADRYAAFVFDQLVTPGAPEEREKETAAEWAALAGRPVPAGVRARLLDPEPHVRFRAADALLARDPADEDARRALLAFADQRTLSPERMGGEAGERRVQALKALVRAGAVDASGLRARLADPRPEHAAMIEATLRLLATSGSPATEDERRAVWRRALDGRWNLGVPAAIRELILLRDRESYDGIGELLESAWDPEKPDDAIARLRALLAQARAETDPPR